uniref:Uncharacterized protein n=1 Tax=Avena sativa TaxID=4498 RepID=A0ACD5W497_AVESA
MAPPIARLRPLSLLLLPRAATTHLVPAFSSSSTENKCGTGPDTPRPQALPVEEQGPPLSQSRTAQQSRRRKEMKQMERRWQRSAVLATLTPAQAAAVATTHPDAVSALDLLIFLSRERSHEYSPDTFATLALRLVEARKCPADVGRARVHMIRSCRTQPEMTRAMDDLDMLARRGPRMDLMAYGTLLIQLNSLGMTATLMDRYRRLLREDLKPNLLIYNTVINALCKDGNVRDARLIMDKAVSESGMKPDGFTYSSMILGYCKNNDLASAIEVFARMGKEGCEPNAAAYSNLINKLCDSGRVNEALDLMAEMTRRAAPPAAYDFTAPIAALCDAGRTEDAWRLFVDMKKKGCTPNVYTYTSLISGQRTPRLAIGLFYRMARDGVLPDTVTYGALIKVLVEDRKMDSALTVCNAMQRHGCLPDTITYNKMIKGYCAIGDTDKAMAMLIDLLKGKPTATLVTYNTIIKGYCDSGNTSAALKILELMEANGCEPDEWSYNELISGFCKISEMESASRLFKEMVGHGLRPDEVTYTTLISGYCKDEKLDRAAEMLEHMKGSGCRPTVRTYNVLIHALTKQNDFSAAEKLCEVMLQEKISPNVVTYSTMIDGLCRNGATSLALEMLNRMVENSCLPSLHTYSSLIQALGQEGKVEEAEELFSDLLSQGHTLDEVAYIKMIEVYVISGKVNRAFDLLGKMINAGCQPTLWTYDVLIKGLQNEYLMGDRNLVSLPDAVSDCSFDDQAIKEYAITGLSSKLADLDLGLSRQLNDALLSGLSRSGRWFEAYKLYRYMVGQGLCPNQEAYNCFIISILRALKVDLAMGVFRHMSAQHRELHLVGYKALICALCQLHRRKEAQFIFEHMLSRAFNPDNIVWTVLIDGLLGAGYKDVCMKFLQIMEKNHRKPSFRSYNILAREGLKKQPLLESVGLDAQQQFGT